MKRLSRILAVLGVVAALSCGRSAPSASSRTTLMRHLIGDPLSLDPTTSTEEPGLLVEAMVFRPLIGIDAQRKPVPALASETPTALTRASRAWKS